MKYIVNADGEYFITRGMDIELSSQYKVFDNPTDLIRAIQELTDEEMTVKWILDYAIYLTKTGRMVLVEYDRYFRMSFDLDKYSIEYIMEYTLNKVLENL